MARLREAEEYVVTNRACGDMIARTACTTDEPNERVGRLASLVARYCPVDALMRPVIPEFEVKWDRKPA